MKVSDLVIGEKYQVIGQPHKKLVYRGIQGEASLFTGEHGFDPLFPSGMGRICDEQEVEKEIEAYVEGVVKRK